MTCSLCNQFLDITLEIQSWNKLEWRNNTRKSTFVVKSDIFFILESKKKKRLICTLPKQPVTENVKTKITISLHNTKFGHQECETTLSGIIFNELCEFSYSETKIKRGGISNLARKDRKKNFWFPLHIPYKFVMLRRLTKCRETTEKKNFETTDKKKYIPRNPLCFCQSFSGI